MQDAFAQLSDSWDLALEAEGNARNSRLTYARGLRSLRAWLAERHPDVDPLEIDRDHFRGWVAHMLEHNARETARSYTGAAKLFFAWLVEEGEIDTDPTRGVGRPRPGEPATAVLSGDELRRLLAGCSGQEYVERRDRAILLMFADTGVRLAELTGLDLADVDVREKVAFVTGKGTKRSGPRSRAVPFGTVTARALDRYLRVRARQPWAEDAALWLGSRGNRRLSVEGVKRMVARRGELAGIKGLHPHSFRHTWAHELRAAGGSEGDLMILGGWRSRQQIDRYGASAASERARDAYRALSLGDRL